MPTIAIRNRFSSDVTVISNAFIDRYMVEANGEFVKIYLCILRWALVADDSWTLCTIADKLDCTTKDVIRALKYWTRVGLLECEYNTEGQLISLTFMDPASTDTGSSVEAVSGQTLGVTSAVEAVSDQASDRNSGSASSDPSISNVVFTDLSGSNVISKDLSGSGVVSTDLSNSGVVSKDSSNSGVVSSDLSGQNAVSELSDRTEHRISISPSRIKALKKSEEVKQIIFIAEQYLGHLLSNIELETILYFYDEAHFSVDLIDYLIEYCVSRNAPAPAYIKKVGFAWMDEGITTVEAAKSTAYDYSHDCFAIMNAYGLRGRAPVSSERDYFKTWFDTYGFSLDIILLAVDKTMAQLHAPRFEYTDTILKAWKDKNVTTHYDVQELDNDHQQSKSQTEKTKGDSRCGIKATTVKTGFKGRDYDYKELEKQLLEAK